MTDRRKVVTGFFVIAGAILIVKLASWQPNPPRQTAAPVAPVMRVSVVQAAPLPAVTVTSAPTSTFKRMTPVCESVLSQAADLAKEFVTWDHNYGPLPDVISRAMTHIELRDNASLAEDLGTLHQLAIKGEGAYNFIVQRLEQFQLDTTQCQKEVG